MRLCSVHVEMPTAVVSSLILNPFKRYIRISTFISTVLQDEKDYYAVQVGPNACLSDTVSVKAVIVLGSKDFDLTSLEYYPNPVEHELTIKNADAINAVTVYDVLGKQIMQKAYSTSELKIDFSSYSAGTYMVRIETVKGSQFVKIIKK